MSLLLGIDVGSQSAKVVVHAADGTVVATGTQTLRPPDTSVPGHVEHPDDDLWEATAAACRQAVDALRAAGHDPADLVGVGLCGVRFCRVLLDADGSLAAPVMSWMDQRVSRPHDPSRPASTVCASSGYLTVRLTGESRDAAASYAGQWPIDVDRWDWSAQEEVVAAYGLRRDQLPGLVLPGEVLGTVTEAASAATGLPVGVPVVATANDKAVEALGGGLRSGDEVLLSLGTYVAAMVTGGRSETVASWENFAAEPGCYLHESTGVRRGMWTVSWLRDLVAGDVPGAEEYLDALAAAVPAGCDGLLTVPDWLAPDDEPHRRGAFVGLDVRHGPGHLYRSVLEGIAMTMRRHVVAMTDELGRTPTRVLLTGGGARSPVMRQVVADVFGLPVHVGSTDSSPAALGAAICAAVGTGVHPSYDAARNAMLPRASQTRPDLDDHATYAALGEVLERLPDALAPLLQRTQRVLGLGSGHG